MNILLVLFFVKSVLVASAVADECDVIPLKKWGGMPSHHEQSLKTPVDLVVVTHTVTGDCFTDAECERIAKAIRNTQIGQGLNDIGLSFLVGGNGKIYEGAGWKVGSHTRGYNERSISLSFIGNFNDKLPKKKALDAAKNFLGCFLNTRYLGCEYNLVGHRQLIATISPGDALQRYIQSWPHWTENVSDL